jgi:hypothetical protein
MVNRRAVFLIKSIHTLIFLLMSAAILYILYSGLTRTYTPLLTVALALVILEVIVYGLNRFRCPLTKWAQHYGDPTGNDLIADLFLPPSLARLIPLVCGGLFALSLLLLLFNLLTMLPA